MKTGIRSFKVLGVKKSAQDFKTTTSKEGRYESRTPMGAASKAFSKHCTAKDIRGQCTFVVVMQETTAGSDKKIFAYSGKRVRHDANVDVSKTKTVHYKYKNQMKSVDVPKYFRKSSH